MSHFSAARPVSRGSIYSLQGCLALLVSGVFCFWMASTLRVDGTVLRVDGEFKKLPMMFTKMKDMSYGKTTQKEQSPHRLGPTREEYRENAQLSLGQPWFEPHGPT